MINNIEKNVKPDYYKYIKSDKEIRKMTADEVFKQKEKVRKAREKQLEKVKKKILKNEKKTFKDQIRAKIKMYREKKKLVM